MHLFLQRCCEIRISLKKVKCRLGLTEIPFMVHVLRSEGFKPNPTKIEAMLKMGPPKDKAGAERLRGTVYYPSRFLPELN